MSPTKNWPTPRVLYEDNHLIAVHKPAGMPSQGDASGDPSIGDWVKEYIREKYKKPGNVYVGLLHRLDRPVSGIILLAKTSKAATRMSEAFRKRKIQKVYQAMVLAPPQQAHGQLRHFVGKVPGQVNIMRAYPKAGEGRKSAVLDYRVLGERNGHCLLEILPHTGRKHQIRVQLAAMGCPIVGDMKYSRTQPLPDRSIALLAQALVFQHPVRKEEEMRLETSWENL